MFMMKKREGFTLVELLIVMAVIAALMGALVPVALSAIRHANATRIAENLESLVTQVQQYAYSNHVIPSTTALSTSVSGGNLKTDYQIYGGNSPTSFTHSISSGSSLITNPLTYFAVVYTGGAVNAADVYNVWSGATKTTISGGTVMATGVINKYW